MRCPMNADRRPTTARSPKKIQDCAGRSAPTVRNTACAERVPAGCPFASWYSRTAVTVLRPAAGTAFVWIVRTTSRGPGATACRCHVYRYPVVKDQGSEALASVLPSGIVTLIHTSDAIPVPTFTYAIVRSSTSPTLTVVRAAAKSRVKEGAETTSGTVAGATGTIRPRPSANAPSTITGRDVRSARPTATVKWTVKPSAPGGTSPRYQPLGVGVAPTLAASSEMRTSWGGAVRFTHNPVAEALPPFRMVSARGQGSPGSAAAAPRAATVIRGSTARTSALAVEGARRRPSESAYARAATFRTTVPSGVPFRIRTSRLRECRPTDTFAKTKRTEDPTSTPPPVSARYSTSAASLS